MSKRQQRKKNPKDDWESKELSAPVITSRVMKSGIPRISTRGGDIVIAHRELLGDVTTVANAGNVQYWEMNPGLYTSSPWLSQIANRFESYTYTRLSFEYVPYCSSTTAGRLIMAPDYDVSDYSPQDPITVSSYPGAVHTSLWQPARMNCDPRLLQKLVKERMVRSDTISDVDMKLYDALCFYAYTYGNAASTSHGSLWVDYEVVLRTPNMDTSVADGDSAKLVATVGVAKATPLGTTPTITNASSRAIISAVDGSHLNFHRAGEYLIQGGVVGTGINNAGLDFTFASPADGEVTHASVGLCDAANTNAWTDAWLHVIRPCVVAVASAAGWATVTQTQLRVSPFKSVLY